MFSLIKKYSVTLVFALAILAPSMAAADINFKSYKIVGNAPSYTVLSAIDFKLSPYLKTALNSGVVLKARVQFRLQEYREWWFNKETVLNTIEYQLKYHALSRHYLLTRNDTNENWNFSTLSAALRKLSELRRYKLRPIRAPIREGKYSIFVAADMAPTTLRLPLRIQSLFSDKYRISSEGVLWPLR